MMKRKLTSLFLATAMVMTTLAGCGNSGGKPAAKVDTSEAAQGKVDIFLVEADYNIKCIITVYIF